MKKEPEIYLITPKRKAAKKKPRTVEIYDNRIKKDDLSGMGLFELSIEAVMTTEVFRELKRRLELIRAYLEVGESGPALDIVNSLLKNPQETRRGES